MQGSINVIHVDDERDFADLTATFLEREDGRFNVTTAASVGEGYDRVTQDVDCVVSDYDMPGENGITFLKIVREALPGLPFILFTGKGSEEVASEAMCAGVTDYIQKESSTEQYEVLANRIGNAVEKHRTERELERRNDLFGRAQDIADIGAWEHDLEGSELVWTEKVYEMHGLPTDFDPTVEKIQEFYHPDDREIANEAIEAAIDDGEPYDITLRMTADEGDTRWFRTCADPQIEDGEVVRIRGTVRDVTDRKSREAELREKSNLLSQLFTQVPIHMYVKDKQGRHRWVSEHHTDAPEEYLGKTDREVFSSEFGEQTYADDMRVIEQEEQMLKKEEYVQQRDEWHRTSKVPWYGETGDIAGLIGVTWDISDQKLFERELQRQNERLEEFTSVVSHELRNPLNVAQGELRLADHDGERLDRVAGALDRMEALIEDLLTLAREGKTVDDRERMDLGDLVDICWQHVELPAASLEIRTDRTIRGDPSRVRQLFGNLFRNAVEHGTADDADLDGTDEHAGDPVTIVVGDLRDGFYVADDGIGVSGDHDRVFEAGHSTTDDGTGFGLSIVAEIIDAHGWEIDLVESDIGGARFEITGVQSVED